MLFAFDEITKRYHYEKYDTLSKLTFDIEKNEIVTLMAEVQSGKSTVAKLLMGLEKPTSGSLSFDGAPYLTAPVDKGIAYFGSQPLLFKQRTVRYNLEYPYRIRKFDKQQTAQIALAAAERYELPLDQKAAKLTMEEQYDLAMARNLSRELNLVILDSVADAVFDKLYDFALSKECAVLILTSDVNQARGRVLIMHNKQIIYNGAVDGARQCLQSVLWLT